MTNIQQIENEMEQYVTEYCEQNNFVQKGTYKLSSMHLTCIFVNNCDKKITYFVSVSNGGISFYYDNREIGKIDLDSFNKKKFIDTLDSVCKKCYNEVVIKKRKFIFDELLFEIFDKKIHNGKPKDNNILDELGIRYYNKVVNESLLDK